MPAARQRSRSPFMAWAVMAMIGRCRPVPFSSRRMRAVASKPSISGICTSISTRSNGCCVQGRQRLLAVAGHHDRVPLLLQQADRQLLVDQVVLGQQDAQRRAGGPAGAGRSAGAAGVRLRTGPGRRAMASNKFRLLDRLDQVGGDAQLPAAGHVARLAGRGQHHHRRSGPAPGRWLDALGQGEAVHLRHEGVEQHQRERLAGRRRLPQGGQRRRAAVHRQAGRMPQLPSTSSRMRRLVALSSTTSTGRPCRRPAGAAADRGHRAGRQAEAGREVEGAALAGLALDPDPAAHQSAPAATRWPGPGRCRRTCAWSSRRPARRPRRSAACFSAGMPMPVSRT